MRVVYYAVEDITVGATTRHPGDLIPEANAWPYLQFYVNKGQIAPVLVATLPEAMQDKLAAWEERQLNPDITPEVVATDAEDTTSDADGDVPEQDQEAPAAPPAPVEVLAPKENKGGRRRKVV